MYFGKKLNTQQQYVLFSIVGKIFCSDLLISQLYSNITLSGVIITEGTLPKVLKLKFLVSQFCQGKTHLPVHHDVNG